MCLFLSQNETEAELLFNGQLEALDLSKTLGCVGQAIYTIYVHFCFMVHIWLIIAESVSKPT